MRLSSACRMPPAAALAVAAASRAGAQTLGGGGGGADISVWRVLGALVFCLLLAAGAAFAMRARLRGALPAFKGQSRRLRLVESLRLSHQTDLCVVDLDGRELLIAATPHGTTLLLDLAPGGR